MKSLFCSLFLAFSVAACTDAADTAPRHRDHTAVDHMDSPAHSMADSAMNHGHPHGHDSSGNNQR